MNEPAVPAPAGGSRRFLYEVLALLVVLALAAGLRLYHLGHESVWTDEGITFQRSGFERAELLSDSIARKHLPTYFFLLKGWRALGVGDSEAVLRFPSAIFGVMSIGLVYLFGRLLGGPWTGFCSALLSALAVEQIRYAQEARMYALLTLFACVTLCGFVWLIEQRELAVLGPRELWRRARARDPQDRAARRAMLAWAAVSLGCVACLYLHNTAVYLVGSVNLAALVIWLRGDLARGAFARNWLIAQGTALALWSFWIPTLFHQVGILKVRWTRPIITPKWLWDVVFELYMFQLPSRWLMALAVGLWLFGAFCLRRRPALLCTMVIVTLTPPVACYLVSRHANMFFARVLLWSAIPWMALIAFACVRLPRLLGAAALVALLAGFSFPLREYYTIPQKPNWRELLTYLREQTNEKSLVFTLRASRMENYYYTRQDGPMPRVRSKDFECKRLEDCTNNVKEFWIVARTSSGKYRGFAEIVRRSGRYRMTKRMRSRDALVACFRRRGPAASAPVDQPTPVDPPASAPTDAPGAPPVEPPPSAAPTDQPAEAGE